MEKSVLAVYKYKGEYFGGIFDSWRDFNSYTWSPVYDVRFCYDFTTKGKTYRERQNYVRNFAIDWSNVFGIVKYDWSCGELNHIQSEFERLGKQYGLLREFHENCIC